jgi:bacillithiol system protein YtxJ
MNWNNLISSTQLDEIIALSESTPCLIFKHSTRCNISVLAKSRLEMQWNLDNDIIQPFYLDLLNHKDISTLIAEKFHVYHESPQVLLIQNGACVLDASHLDIDMDEIKSCL